MKKLVVVVFVLVSFGVKGQWNTNTDVNVPIYRTGNVGIGTSSPPTQKLDVAGNINMAGASGRRLFMGGVGGTTFGIAFDAGSPNYGLFYTEAPIDFVSISPNGNATNGVLNVYGDGKVGIGNSTASANVLQIGPNPQGWSGNDLVISNSNPGQIALAISNANDHTMLYGSSDIAIRPGFGKWSVYAKGSDGYVGIGINNPTAPLQVGSGTEKGLINLGGYAHIGNLRSSGDLFAGMNVYAGYATSDENSKVKVLSSNSYGFSGVQMSYNGDINFFAKTGAVTANDQANTSANTVLKIVGNGNVGIGTTSPDAKLAVKGSIHTQEVKVDLQGAVAPDYVFEKNYNLKSLTEIENYINQNKHLPEIPSAKEMEENGLHLKEMNLLLLKKVEELTLHLIEQQKQMNEMKNEITNLKRK